jgi:hypothetical protein
MGINSGNIVCIRLVQWTWFHGSNPESTNSNLPNLVDNLDPETAFPFPGGILNHKGANHIALTLCDKQGATLGSLELIPTSLIRSGYNRPQAATQPVCTKRAQSY